MTTSTPDLDEATESQQTLQQLLHRAHLGDFTVLPELRRVLDQDRRLWEVVGNLALQAEAGLVKLAAGPDLLLAEAMIRKQAELKTELAGDDADPLVKALAERTAICSLQAAYFDGLMNSNQGKSVSFLEPLRKHMDSANKRFVNAIKMLATVKKLVRPSISPIAIATRMEPRRTANREDRMLVGVEN